MAQAHALLPCLLHPHLCTKAKGDWAGLGVTVSDQGSSSVTRAAIQNPAPAKPWPLKTGFTHGVGGTDPLRLPPTEERGMALLLGIRTARSLQEEQFNCLARLMRKIQR